MKYTVMVNETLKPFEFEFIIKKDFLKKLEC